MKLLPLLSVWFALALCQPVSAQDSPPQNRTDNKNIQMRLRNGSIATGQISYITPDGKIVELQTPQGTEQAVWYNDVVAVRRDRDNKRWRQRPHPYTLCQRYDPNWKDATRWELGFYGDYGFGVGNEGLDRYEVGLNVRYGINQYLFVGAGVGINSIRDVYALSDAFFEHSTNTTGCALFANMRGYFRNRGIRPFADLRVGYNFATSNYPAAESRNFSDEGVLMRIGAGIAYVDRSDITYSLSAGYQMHSVELTETTRNTFRRLSESIAIQFAVTFRW